MHWVSTDIRHFVQSLTPKAEDSNGVVSGRIEDEFGASTALYEMRQINPPTEYHIETDGEIISDWLVLENGEKKDFQSRALTDDQKLYVVDALISGMLVQK